MQSNHCSILPCLWISLELEWSQEILPRPSYSHPWPDSVPTHQYITLIHLMWGDCRPQPVKETESHSGRKISPFACQEWQRRNIIHSEFIHASPRPATNINMQENTQPWRKLSSVIVTQRWESVGRWYFLFDQAHEGTIWIKNGHKRSNISFYY